ncbi:hypothetical protein BsWGS_00531 [Bradybaena similaris]
MGHQANFLKEPSPEGFTHDWTVFVRGFEGSRLEYFVEKVVFKLHKTFKSPIRVITEPPFRVSESGYAGFILPIEIHFKNKQTPRKIIFLYDLFLNAKDSPPINNVRYEKLKFQNPTPEFKAKLIKAGGTEQGPEHASSDLFGSPVRTEKRALPKVPKDKEKDKEKVKKKKSSPQFKSASPAPSLSSLSPMSSDNEDSYSAPPPPPPVKKERELSVKKESSSSSQPKQDSSLSHKEKSKHRSGSSISSHKERSDKDPSHKSHKHKDKTKESDRSSSHRDKEAVRKDRDSSSQKVVKETFESRKEREGSHSSGKSLTSSSQLDNKAAVQTPHKEKEKSLQSKDKDILGSSKEKLHSSSKDREKLSKDKHSSHKDVSHTSHSEPKKVKEDISKDKIAKENDRHHKSHKRHMESAEDAEKRKLKRSSSVASTDEKSIKMKSSSGKEKHVSRDNKEKESSKEVKESKSSYDKSKHEKSRHSEKQRHSHSSETKQKESSTKLSETPHKHEKVNKPESLTHSERLAMTADFQPQLLLSPLKSKSDEEETPAPSPHAVEKTELKRSTSHSSPDSQSSAVSGEDKSDQEMVNPQADEDKHIVSGLTDSDSDSEEEAPYMKSQQKDLKSILNKQSQQTTQVTKSSLQKIVRGVSTEEKQKKVESEPTKDTTQKYSKTEKKASITEPVKSKSVEQNIEYSDAGVEQANAANSIDSQNCNGLDIFAPNGMSIGELIAINEQIEKAHLDSNQELLERVVHIIGETDDFDITDVSLSFDICSVDKAIVLQIQTLLREY